MRAGPQPTELGPVVAVYRPMFLHKAAMQRWQAASIRTHGDVLTNDIAPAIYRVHDAWRILLLRGRGAMGDGLHAWQVNAVVSALSCQWCRDRHSCKAAILHSHTPWP